MRKTIVVAKSTRNLARVFDGDWNRRNLYRYERKRKMSCFQCCNSEEKAARKSLKKSIKEYHDTKTLASFANISFKSGNAFSFASIPAHQLSRNFVLSIENGDRLEKKSSSSQIAAGTGTSPKK